MLRQRWFSLCIVLVILVSFAGPVNASGQVPAPTAPPQPSPQGIRAVFHSSNPQPAEPQAAASGAPFRQNLIANGDAETGDTNPWHGGADDFIVTASYGSAPFPLPTDPGPMERGSSLFVGSGYASEINAWQEVDISAFATAVDSGTLQFVLSGYFGGIGTYDERAYLRVYFNQADGQGVPGSTPVVIGDVSAAERKNISSLLPREARGFIPKGARQLVFQLQNLSFVETNPCALADNLSFVIQPFRVVLPFAMTPAGQQVKTPPAAPSNLSVQPAGVGSLQLSWKDNSTTEKGFQIERAPGGTTNFATLAYTQPDITTYADAGLADNTPFIYRIRAFNDAGSSGQVSATGMTLPPPAAPPAAPASCWTSGTSSSTTVLSWEDSSDNEQVFKVYIFVPPGDYRFLTNVEANATSLTITDLPPDWTVYFRVSASNSAGESTRCQTSAHTNPAGIVSGFSVRNSASYPIVYLDLDGIQQFPVYPMGIMPGDYYEMDIEPGLHTYEIRTGFWQDQNHRFDMYTYQGSFDLPDTGVSELEVLDVTLAGVLTQFSESGYGYWEGYYFDSGANCHTAAFLFGYDDTYQFFVGNNPQGIGTYSLTARQPDIFGLKFSVSGLPGEEALLLEMYGEFYLKNGPDSWKQITYVYKPQGYVYNQFCP